jgi:hypothetical protein
MNSFFCSGDRPFNFFGRMNDDVNAYTRLGNVGELFFTVPFVSLAQRTTQHAQGGMSEFYLDTGTYVKSFYSVMYMPSSVKIFKIGNQHHRIHHRVNWKTTVPCILQEQYKK